MRCLAACLASRLAAAVRPVDGLSEVAARTGVSPSEHMRSQCSQALHREALCSVCHIRLLACLGFMLAFVLHDSTLGNCRLALCIINKHVSCVP